MIAINLEGKLLIQTNLSTSDYPHLMKALLTVCSESVANPNFESTVADAVCNVLNFTSEMLPTEVQAKTFLETPPVINYSSEIELIKESMND
jgi:hypothetical protein